MTKWICIMLLTGTVCYSQMGARSFVPSKISSTSPGESTSDGVGLVDEEKFPVANLPTFGLYGIGNTNTEVFENIDASGKLSGFIRPFKGNLFKKKIPSVVELSFGFNVNASNTDSLAVKSILFPDVGDNSFSTTVLWSLFFGNGDNFYIASPFFEFAHKTIKGREEDESRSFYTLNSSVGLNLQYLYIDRDSDGQKEDKISISISPYVAWVNIPDPGKEDYRYLLTGDENSALIDNIKSAGVKVTFQYNYFQIFADFRDVHGNKSKLPVKGFGGFHPNIGVVFNAEIFER